MDSAEFLDILGNANRRRILRLLAQKPCYVTEISDVLGVSPKAVIDHLEQLEEAGLVASRTDDRRRKYFSIERDVRLEVTVSPYEFGTKSAYPSNSRIDIASCRRLTVDVEHLDTFADRSDATGDSRDGPAAGPSGDGAGSNPQTDAGQTGSSTPGSSDPADGGPTAAASGDDAGPSAASGESHRETRTERPARKRPVVAAMARQLHDLDQLDSELSMAQRWTQGRMTMLRRRVANAVDLGNPRLVSDLLLALAEEPRQVETLSRLLDVPPGVVEELLDALADQGVVTADGRAWSLADSRET